MTDQLFEVNYESPKKLSPTTRRREKNKGHVTIEVEKEKESLDPKSAGSPPPPQDSAKEDSKKSSKKIGAALVDRWKSLRSKSLLSKSIEKEEVAEGELIKSPSKKQADETPTSNKKVSSPSPKTPIKSNKKEDGRKKKPIPTVTSPKNKSKAKDTEKSNLRSKSKDSMLTSDFSSDETSSDSSPEIKPATNKPRSSRIQKTTDKKATPNIPPDETLLFGITIHGTDMLPLDPNVLHPVVKVTLMNQDGTFIRKSSRNEPNNDEENENNKTDKKKRKRERHKKSSGSDHQVSPAEAILPIMTQPYSFTFALRNPSLCPSWDELLLYEEPFQKLVQKESQIILFFEIMDFLPMNNSSRTPLRRFHGKTAVLIDDMRHESATAINLDLFLIRIRRRVV